MKIRNDIYLTNEDRLIYKLVEIEELDSNDLCMVVNLELIAGWDYINPDESNAQGYVSAENFVDDVQLEQFTFLPESETLKDCYHENNFVRVDINTIKIHQ